MKAKVDMRIKLLDGEEKGREFFDHKIFETESEITKFGIVERLKINWAYVHPTMFWEKQNEIVISDRCC